MMSKSSVDPARRSLVAAMPEAEYNLGVFDTYVEDHGAAAFAVFKVGGGIVDEPDNLSAFAESTAEVRRLGFTPVIVHGGGPQIDAALEDAGIKSQRVEGLRVTTKEGLEVTERVLLKVGQTIVDSLWNRDIESETLMGVIDAEPIDRATYGEVGRVTGVNIDRIADVVKWGSIPVVSCLGKTPSGNTLNVNADDSAAAVVRALRPLKYVSMTSTGGVSSGDGSLMRVLTPEIIAGLKGDGVVNGGMQKKVDEALGLLGEGVVKDVVIVDPKHLLSELFTHEGYGTLITNGETLREYGREDIGGADRAKIRRLIESAFDGKRLPDDYFDRTDISRLLITSQRYDGVGIFTVPEDEVLAGADIEYMDKLAVSDVARGRGVAQQIVETAAREKGIFWRCSPDNPYRRKYEEIADGWEHHIADNTTNLKDNLKDWVIFWTNVGNDKTTLGRVINYAKTQPVTLL